MSSQDATKLLILDAAERLFLRQGIVGTKMEAIAHEAGLSVGGLYWHYTGKQALISDYLRLVFDPDLEELRDLANSAGSSRQILERCLLRTAEEDRTLRPVFQEIYAMATRDTSLRALLHSYFIAYRTLYEDILRSGMDAGEWQIDDVSDVATSILALYEGVLELSSLSPEPVDPALQILGSLETLFHGLGVCGLDEGES